MMARNVCYKFWSSIYLMLSLLLLISLASCYPEFKNPIPPPPELKADSQILGTWVRTFKADQRQYKEQLSIFPRRSGWIDAVWIYDIDRKGHGDGINLLVLEGYNTFVNKQRFLCLRFREKDFNRANQKDHRRSDKEFGKQPFAKYWIIVNYETPNNGELFIKPFSTQKVEDLIEKGNLKGEVVKEEMFKEQAPSLDKVTVTSSSDELVEVISREGAGPFIWDDPNDTFRFMNILVFSKLGDIRDNHE
jgi:hypothetical protein